MTDPFANPTPPPGDPAGSDSPSGPPPGLAGPSSGPEAPILSIGDIAVTRTSVIVPEGRFPVRGTTWTVQDATTVSDEIPQWAIIAAIVGLFVVCVFSLLFLLVKEKRYAGFISVTVIGDGLYHTVNLPPGPQSAAWVMNQVNHARTLAATA